MENLDNPNNPFLKYLVGEVEKRDDLVKKVEKNEHRISRIERGIIWVSGVGATIGYVVSKVGASRLLSFF